MNIYTHQYTFAFRSAALRKDIVAGIRVKAFVSGESVCACCCYFAYTMLLLLCMCFVRLERSAHAKQKRTNACALINSWELLFFTQCSHV